MLSQSPDVSILHKLNGKYKSSTHCEFRSKQCALLDQGFWHPGWIDAENLLFNAFTSQPAAAKCYRPRFFSAHLLLSSSWPVFGSSADFSGRLNGRVAVRFLCQIRMRIGQVESAKNGNSLDFTTGDVSLPSVV